MTTTQAPFPVLGLETAPAASRELLKGAKAKLGFVPNLFGVLAGSPALLESYLTLSSLFDRTSLSPTERQIVLLATSFENGCDYCMAAHSAIAGMQKVAPAVVAALREGRPIEEEPLEALRAFTTEVVRERGWPSEQATHRLVAAGYTEAQILEVLLGVGLKTLSNYVNHFAHTPLDSAFEPVRWTRPAGQGCACAQ